MTDGAGPTIGVLSLHTSKETKAILNAAEDLGAETEWLRTENTTLEVRDGRVGLDPAVDVVVNRLLLSGHDQPIEGLGLAHTIANCRPMLNRPGPTMTAMHKFACAVRLAAEGVAVPDALLALSRERLAAESDRFGDEAVYKTAIGTHGSGAWRVDLSTPVEPRVGTRQAFLQAFVPGDGSSHRDVRVYVVDGDVVAAMSRTAPDDEWRTNVALGGAVDDVTDDLPAEVAALARRTVDVLDLDYAGVDVIDGPDGWVVLEVNPTAGFRGLFRAAGVSPAPNIARLAIERAGGTVSDAAVDGLAGTLDDSRPSCMPRRTGPRPVEPMVVGFVERVVVSGTRGSQAVYAKSDTGATRTSIDAGLAAEIGTGPVTDVVTVKSGSSKTGRSRPLVDLVVGLGGSQHTVTANVEDRSHMTYPLLLGRDVLEGYHVDVTRRADVRDGDARSEE
jgi:RimK family alpha-L-glutamate ligase